MEHRKTHQLTRYTHDARNAPEKQRPVSAHFELARRPSRSRRSERSRHSDKKGYVQLSIGHDDEEKSAGTSRSSRSKRPSQSKQPKPIRVPGFKGLVKWLFFEAYKNTVNGLFLCVSAAHRENRFFRPFCSPHLVPRCQRTELTHDF